MMSYQYGAVAKQLDVTQMFCLVNEVTAWRDDLSGVSQTDLSSIELITSVLDEDSADKLSTVLSQWQEVEPRRTEILTRTLQECFSLCLLAVRYDNNALGEQKNAPRLECMRRLVAAGAQHLALDSDGQGLVHLAAVSGNKNLMQFVLEIGCNPNQSDADGVKPVLHCLRTYLGRSSEEVLRTLLIAGADPNEWQRSDNADKGFDPRNNDCAVLLWRKNMLMSICAYGGELPIECSRIDPIFDGITMLKAAALSRDVRRLFELIEQERPDAQTLQALKGDVQTVFAKKPDEVTEVIAAIDASASRALLSNIASRRMTTWCSIAGENVTPTPDEIEQEIKSLLGIVKKGGVSWIAGAGLILADGVEIDLASRPAITILAQADVGDADALKRTIKEWVAPDDSSRHEVLCAAMHLASKHINLENVRSWFSRVCAVLLAAGADPCSLGEDGRSVLHRACKMGDVQAAELMLQAKCPVDILDIDGRTPLGWAVNAANIEMTRMMLRAGANPNHRGRTGELMHMCDLSFFSKSRVLTWLLLAYGAERTPNMQISAVYRQGTQIQAAACAGDVQRMCELLDAEPGLIAKEIGGLRTILEARMKDGEAEDKQIAQKSLAAAEAYLARDLMMNVARRGRDAARHNCQ